MRRKIAPTEETGREGKQTAENKLGNFFYPSSGKAPWQVVICSAS